MDDNREYNESKLLQMIYKKIQNLRRLPRKSTPKSLDGKTKQKKKKCETVTSELANRPKIIENMLIEVDPSQVDPSEDDSSLLKVFYESAGTFDIEAEGERSESYYEDKIED